MNFTKSSKLLGDTIPYHPHSLDSLYGVLVNLTTDMNSYKLFQGKGNWGGVGFGAAAYRYTEAYLNEMARFMYTQFSDYSQFIEGESGLTEPKYLPALIPYSLMIGASGIGVGLSTNIMPLDVMDLIDYYISVIKGEEPRTPTPDLGNFILDMSDKEIDASVESSEGKLVVKSVLTSESDTIVVLDDIYGKGISSVVKKMSDWLDTGLVDYRDETTTSPRYVFEIMDKRVTLKELKDRLDRLTKARSSYRRLVADGEVGVYAPLHYQIIKSLEYLNESLDRMFEDKLAKLNHNLLVLEAIRDIRSSSLLNEIPSLTTNQFKDKVKDMGYDDDVVNSAVSKSMTYLTKSHDNELKDIKQEIKKLESVDRTEYLVELYTKLREIIKPIYDKAKHTVRRSKLLKYPKFSFVDGNILRISDKGKSFDKTIYGVHADGSIQAYHVGSSVKKDIRIDESEASDLIDFVPDSGDIVVLITNHRRVLVTDLLRALSRIMIRLDDDEKVERVDITKVNEDGSIEFSYKRKHYDGTAYYRKRLSNPQPLGNPIK